MELVTKYTTKYNISREDFYKIVAFWFTAWGGRGRGVEGKWEYWLDEEAILDSSSTTFDREVQKAIRNCLPKLGMLDDLWSARKRSALLPDLQVEVQDLTDKEHKTVENLLYGTSEDD
jgi:hypothetical protein